MQYLVARVAWILVALDSFRRTRKGLKKKDEKVEKPSDRGTKEL